MQTLHCVRCASDLPADARFCPKCGGSVDDESPPTIESSRLGSANAARPPSRRGYLSTPALDEGRFVPGEVLAERYRIVALLGKGGMGEVYRAEDMRLGQPVAMKFLPPSVAQDGAALARFHREVRLARQVSHANVCRVFDIAEADGLSFLTMEYVDGEDLATLLRRIGRLPQDKAVDISRQLCAGLAAAHEAGVLHRDLKPANIMLDKRGKVRITDFGLAGLAVSDDQRGAGTPAYMAPEQLAGEPTTVQSDIYSLGLVLYEVFTGKRVFEAASLADSIREHKTTTPRSPSQLVEGFDPVVERVIFRCLEDEPAQRPRSALQVAAALPGGDPLAAALAAGETPSPEMVAAAGGEGALRPRTGWILVAAALLVLAAVVVIAPYSTDFGVAPPRKTPASLEARAEEILERSGYTATPADHATWMERNYDFLRYNATHAPTSIVRRELPHAEQGVLSFFYRQSPQAMVPIGESFRVGAFDPPQEVSGMALVVLDSNARLLGLLAVPPQVEEHAEEHPPATVTEPDWNALLADTGLDPATLKPAESTWLPPTGFDRRMGWRGFYPEDPKTEIQISAASYRGKPVYFHVIGPWTRPWRMPEPPPVRSSAVRNATFVIGGFLTLVAAGLFARRNIRLGRGDRRGAFRISAFIFSGTMLACVLIAHHVTRLGGEWQILTHLAGAALFGSAFVWLYYLALEPYVRRQWPELLISWTRLLAGRFRDPLIGRDLLVGVLLGSLMGLGIHVANALPGWVNVSGQTTIPGMSQALGSANDMFGSFVGQMIISIFPAFATTFTLFVTRLAFKNYWISAILTGILVLLATLGGENFALEAPFVITNAVLMMFVLLRLGFLALTITIFVFDLLTSFQITLDFSRWYAPNSMLLFAALLAMLFYGLRVGTGNRPLLGTD